MECPLKTIPAYRTMRFWISHYRNARAPFGDSHRDALGIAGYVIDDPSISLLTRWLAELALCRMVAAHPNCVYWYLSTRELRLHTLLGSPRLNAAFKCALSAYEYRVLVRAVQTDLLVAVS